MRAAVLETWGEPLVVRTLADPAVGTGEVLVDVVAAGVLSYSDEVCDGRRDYGLDLPIVPGTGGVGRVRAVGPDATRLAVGDWVLCDPTVRSRDDAGRPDVLLQGWAVRSDGARRLHRHHHDGAWASMVRVPTENAIALGPIDPGDAPAWCALGTFLVPYGGLLAVDLQPGEVALVSGSTGHFGSAAVAVALAVGAACVVCPGRNRAVLADLQQRFGRRVRTVELTGDETADRTAMAAAAPGPIDVVIDLLPPSAAARVARTALLAVRPGGRVALMGGVGLDGGEDLALPYPWLMRNDVTVRGQWMYPAAANTRLMALVHAGLLRLDDLDVTTFPLDAVNEAIAHAAAHGGAFQHTVLCP